MRVLYDYQKFSTQRTGGITRYFSELFTHFGPDVDPVVSLRFNRNIYISGNDSLFLRKVSDYDFRFAGKSVLKAVVDRINRCYSVYDIRHCEYDIFHPTYYGCYFMSMDIGRPVVVTVHDMIQELFPDDFSEGIIADKRRQILGADHIVAVSENTKRDILSLYPQVSPEKISVIYHGASFADLRPAGCACPEKFILFVGRRDGYKNFRILLSALKPLLERDRDMGIVCAGEPFRHGEQRLIAESGLGGRVFSIGASDAQLLYLYSKAEAFVFPSLYEGFGLPILEAFRAGCPVCLADASCFPEIAEDAAIYFDPRDEVALLEAVTRCMEDRSLRGTLVRKGKERLRAFDWTASAASLGRVYASLI